MGHKFAEIAFTDAVKAVQTKMGSRNGYARRAGGDVDFNDRLGPGEASFISERDSFYMATISERGWPYIQHRGGPKGFLRVLDEKTIGFADFSGNRQYVSVGNIAGNDRVSLFLMDYPGRTRLKLLGRARLIGVDEADTMARLTLPQYPGRIERGFLITVEAFDWNCPQHITPRFTAEEIERVVGLQGIAAT
ncbi:MAG: pyridoxamine 5'-phosphate oxidase family protein [Hyphomicrobiaceae bacterium]|nr:pyridoxamine 5'-phosphate oxidase family protein [Hyphomicrobiaceae bacterium]